MRTKKLITALSIAVLSLSVAESASATSNAIQKKMDAIFGEMSNVTAPGVYNSQRRGVLSGGSVIVRSPIMNTSLLNIQLPNFDAGCGGIDAFAGSLSFINADQFVALLRNIAANAKGYAFKIAIDAASAIIGANLSELQDVIQKINNMNLNSCELAKGIVNTGIDALRGNDVNMTSRLSNYFEGMSPDFSTAKLGFGNVKNAVSEVLDKYTGHSGDTNISSQGRAIAENLVGNVVWKQLKKNNIRGMLYNAGDNDADEYGAIMAITGTYIFPKPTENETNPQTSDFPSIPYPAIIDQISKLIDGGEVRIYKCKGSDASTDCTSMEQQTLNITSLKQRIENAIVGDRSTTGIITKYRHKDMTLSAEEQKIMNGLTNSSGAIIRQLAIRAPEAAYDMAGPIAEALASQYVFQLSKTYITLARLSVAASNATGKEEVLQALDRRSAEIIQQEIAYNATHYSPQKLLAYYNSIKQNLESIELGTSYASRGAVNIAVR